MCTQQLWGGGTVFTGKKIGMRGLGVMHCVQRVKWGQGRLRPCTLMVFFFSSCILPPGWIGALVFAAYVVSQLGRRLEAVFYEILDVFTVRHRQDGGLREGVFHF